jgi:putative PIN family toxin of toxin-antitoxin system
MTDSLPRVVLDTVVFVQALISGRGHAAGCLEQLRAGRFVLLMSDATFDELKDVPLRPSLAAKYPFITSDKVTAFVAEIESLAVRIANPAAVITLPRDPKDEPFIDLAVAGSAQFIVTWNQRHLTYLMRQDTPEGKDFCTRFPAIKILSPIDFMSILTRTSS